MIFGPFIARKPWAAAIIGFFLGPVGGMLYVGRGKLAFAYFIGLLLVWLGLIFSVNREFSTFDIAQIQHNLRWIMMFIGAVHSYIIAQKNLALPRPWFSRWYSIAGIYFVPLLLALLFRIFFYEPFHLPSDSMSPAANKGAYLFADKRYGQPQRGDVVIFKVPRAGQPSVDYIKRIIGMPNETLQIKGGIVYINDQPLAMQQLADIEIDGKTYKQFIETLPEGKQVRVIHSPENATGDDTQIFTIPAGHYFMLGDNRNHSRDSRFDIGTIAQERITGKAIMIFWNSATRTLVNHAVE